MGCSESKLRQKHRSKNESLAASLLGITSPRSYLWPYLKHRSAHCPTASSPLFCLSQVRAGIERGLAKVKRLPSSKIIPVMWVCQSLAGFEVVEHWRRFQWIVAA